MIKLNLASHTTRPPGVGSLLGFDALGQKHEAPPLGH